MVIVIMIIIKGEGVNGSPNFHVTIMTRLTVSSMFDIFMVLFLLILDPMGN